MARTELVKLDGSHGEGGGQVLRTALSASAIAGTGFVMEKIRARRDKPGLLRQHLTAVRAAAEVCDATLEGAELGSQTLKFLPGPIKPGKYEFAIGTAGSTTLVAQTVLPMLLQCAGESELVIEGGTHNPKAPTFDFFAEVFLDHLRRMGAQVEARVERYGFLPAGGGRIVIHVAGGAALRPLTLTTRAGERRIQARVLVAHLPEHVAEREAALLKDGLGLDSVEIQTTGASPCAGNAVFVTITDPGSGLKEMFESLGAPRTPSEVVAQRAMEQARNFLKAGVPVGEHLADQLLLPMVLAGGGSFCTVEPSQHTLTQMRTLGEFFQTEFLTEMREEGVYEIRV